MPTDRPERIHRATYRTVDGGTRDVCFATSAKNPTGVRRKAVQSCWNDAARYGLEYDALLTIDGERK